VPGTGELQIETGGDFTGGQRTRMERTARSMGSGSRKLRRSDTIQRMLRWREGKGEGVQLKEQRAGKGG